MAISSIGTEGMKQVSVKKTPNWNSLTPEQIRRKTKLERSTEKSHPHGNLETTVLIFAVGLLKALDHLFRCKIFPELYRDFLHKALVECRTSIFSVSLLVHSKWDIGQPPSRETT